MVYTIGVRIECCLQRLYSVVGVIPKEGLAGPRPPIRLLV